MWELGGCGEQPWDRSWGAETASFPLWDSPETLQRGRAEPPCAVESAGGWQAAHGPIQDSSASRTNDPTEDIHASAQPRNHANLGKSWK